MRTSPGPASSTTRVNRSKSSIPAWRVRVMPVSGAQHASVHEMLQAAVHSMYIREGSWPASSGRAAGGSSFFNGSFSGQSPQNVDPPAFRSERTRVIVAPHAGNRLGARVAERTFAVRVGAAADNAPVAQHDERRPRPGALKPGCEE